MAYYSGTATSASDLITAINNAATANGWTLSATGNILSKGNVHAQLSQWNPKDNTITDKGIGVQIGTGQSSGALTVACAAKVGIRTDIHDAVNLSYSCTYHIFINTIPDEIVVAVNYNSSYWQWLAFGQAIKIGVTGLGIYCWGSSGFDAGYDYWLGFGSNLNYSGYNLNPCFWGTIRTHSFIHLSLESNDWWPPASYNTKEWIRCYNSVGDVLRKQPNTWNSEALLVRTQLLASRASGFYSYVAELPHFRWIRNTYIDDGTVITLGTDKWFVAPVHKKDLNATPSYNTNHSGTNGFAVRKTV
jgi:hypothetical protein